MENEAKNYALIKDGAIQNVVVADEAFISTSYPDYTWADLTDLSPCPGIGWTQNEDGSFTDPNKGAGVVEQPIPDPKNP